MWITNCLPASDNIQVRIAEPTEAHRIRPAYTSLGYHREVNLLDTVWLAENAGEVAGIVRVAAERGVLVLRGMRIAEPFRRQRIGTRLVKAILEWLGDRSCYCIPYSHLTGFYGRAGFIEIEPDAAALFLAERLAEYRRSGLEVSLMQRPAYFLGARPSVSSM